MPLHVGQSYCHHRVCIGSLDPDYIQTLPQTSDIRDAVAFYLPAAPKHTDISTFGIYQHETPVGQISLHDIDWQAGENLVAYNLFLPPDRGRGIGTTALSLLQQYVSEATTLTRLFVITSRDNVASQRIATKCQFHLVGCAHDEPDNLLVFA